MRAAQLDRWPGVASATDESGPPPNVQRVAKLEEEQLRARSISERIAAAVTRAAGTATFAIAHLVWFTGWIVVNSTWARGIERFDPFDPFPFNLLTMLVSLEAIFLSIWILISQNQMTRQADRRAHLDLQINLLAEQESTASQNQMTRQADRRAHLDLQINLLAEQESTATLRIVHDIAEHLGIGGRASRRDPALVEETDIEHLASRMDEVLPDAPGTVPSEQPRSGGMASP